MPVHSSMTGAAADCPPDARAGSLDRYGRRIKPPAYNAAPGSAGGCGNAAAAAPSTASRQRLSTPAPSSPRQPQVIQRQVAVRALRVAEPTGGEHTRHGGKGWDVLVIVPLIKLRIVFGIHVHGVHQQPAGTGRAVRIAGQGLLPIEADQPQCTSRSPASTRLRGFRKQWRGRPRCRAPSGRRGHSWPPRASGWSR